MATLGELAEFAGIKNPLNDLLNGHPIPAYQLLIDGNGYWLPEKLGWRNGDNAWASFLEVITKASAFDVYVDDKKVASFAPTPQSTKTVLGDLSDCVYRPAGM